MLNLVYHDTQDERVYQVLSRRMKDRFDIFGGLPDTIDDDWIESVEKLEEMMDTYIDLRGQARNAFELRYQETIDPDKDRWELCSRVLCRRDVWTSCRFRGEASWAGSCYQGVDAVDSNHAAACQCLQPCKDESGRPAKRGFWLL
jgi:hypothetical protein